MSTDEEEKEQVEIEDSPVEDIAEASDDQPIEKKRAPKRVAKRKRKKKSESREVSIEELPSISFLIGGDRAKWFIPVSLISILLISLLGGMIKWNMSYADPDPSFNGTSREYHDCIAVNYKYGSRNSSDHDPYHQDNIICAEKQGIDPNWSELEYQEWLTNLLSGFATDDGNHSGFVWSEAGIATMTYLVSTMNTNMSVYFDPSAGDEFNGTHLALWNSATTEFGGGNDTYEDLLPGGGTAMAMFVGPGGIVEHKPTGYVWTAVGLVTMEYLFSLNNANMSLYGYPSEGDVFTNEHLGIWNAATVGFGGGNDSMTDLVPGGGSALAMYIGAGGIVLWSNLSDMPTAANVSINPTEPTASDVLTCPYDYSDPQGDADASTIRWYLNGARTLDDAVPSELNAGDEVSCSVLPSDGTNPGFRVHSATVTIA